MRCDFHPQKHTEPAASWGRAMVNVLWSVDGGGCRLPPALGRIFS